MANKRTYFEMTKKKNKKLLFFDKNVRFTIILRMKRDGYIRSSWHIG